MDSPSEAQASEDLATFFAVSIDMLCIRDMAGRFVKLSQSWEQVLGYPVADLLDRPLLPLVHPDDVAATRAHMEGIKIDGEIVGFINRYRHRDGRYRHLEWRAKLSGDRVFAVARDVTDRLAAEAALRAAKEAAEAANRAKSDFLANMSHEIRTPLNGVIGVVAALAQTKLTAVQRDMLGLVQTSGMTLERLVSDILDVSKIEAGQFELEARPFDLRDELDAVLRMNELRASEKGLVLEVEYGEAARGEFLADATRIKQVLGNLLSNAVKFTHEGEVRLTVAVSGPDDTGPGASLTLEVRDTGVGFDAKAVASLFQRFSQADGTITRRFGGSGLGLAICKSIVEMMDGEIAAEAEPGQGSLFRVTIPVARTRSLADYDQARGDGQSATGAGTGGAAGGLDGLRILLAEDHPINQRVVQLILEPFGVQITTVENGQAAVEAFEAGTFDLVLMDMQMPVMDGLAATMAIRRGEADGPTAPTPIIMLSANAMAQHVQQALAAGADRHIPKPITAESLLDGIQAALDEVAQAATETD